MSANRLEIERREMSSMSPRTDVDAGQNVPGNRESAARAFAGWMLVATGGLVLANTAISSAGPEVTGSDWSFALLAATIAYVAARGLWTGSRWAWWVSLAYGGVGLFFVLPVTAAIVFGSSREPVGTGWDTLLFPVITAVMLALVAALWIARPTRSV
jgi:hypothetical protein